MMYVIELCEEGTASRRLEYVIISITTGKREVDETASRTFFFRFLKSAGWGVNSPPEVYTI